MAAPLTSARVLAAPTPMPLGAAWGAPAGVWLAPPTDDTAGPAAHEVPVLRILIVADDALARAGLAAVLAEFPDCAVVGQVAPDADVQEAIEETAADVLIWDAERGADVPDLDGFKLPVLVLSPGPSPALAGRPAIHGVLSREADAPILVAALRAIAKGLIVVDPALGTAAPSRTRLPAALAEALTPRELEVLQSLAAGLPNKGIAQRLGISEHTVRFHLNAIFGKLEAHTRTEAVAVAARWGLIAL